MLLQMIDNRQIALSREKAAAEDMQSIIIPLSRQNLHKFELLKAGKNEIYGEADVYLLESRAMQIMKDFSSTSLDMVIDYEHQTLRNVEAPASGWIKRMYWDDGLWVEVEWTDKARKMIMDKEYKYFSPVIISNNKREVIALHNVALTNQPKLKHAAEITIAKQKIGDKDMNELAKLIELLKMAKESTFSEVLEEVKRMAEENAKLKKAAKSEAEIKALKNAVPEDILDALGLDKESKTAVVCAKIESLSEAGGTTDELSKQLQEQSLIIAKMQADSLIKEAVTNGKVTNAELENWAEELALTQPKQFRQIVLSRSPYSVVPMKNDVRQTTNPETVSDELKAVASQMGLDEETMKKYGGE
jgi:phage I-like protein